MQDYSTVCKQATAEIVIKRSRFIGLCAPCEDEQQALSVLSGVKKEHPQARHHCHAFVVGADGQRSRYSDDGEPHGTAGLPILETIRNKELTNLIVVVTRYFGGVLLGAPGLVRAYTQAAAAAINEAEIARMRYCRVYFICVEYALRGKIDKMLNAKNVYVIHEEFGKDIQIEAAVCADWANGFEKELLNATNGKISFKQTGTGHFPQRPCPL